VARWLGKAALQKGMSALPKAESANYLFQRHVSRSLPASEAGFRRKLDRAVSHVDAYEAHGPERGRSDAVFYEFGAGWDLGVQLAYWALGVERQILVDIHPNLRFELVNKTIERLESSADERLARRPGAAGVASAQELEQRFGIAYVAPCDARVTGFESGSVDFVSSTNTLEHIPAGDLEPILVECRRLLRGDGIMSSRIDLRDHYSYFDRSLSPYNFLRYSDRSWRAFNSRLLYQNRLRRPDYVRAFTDAGFEIVEEVASSGDDAALGSLRGLELAPRFRGYSFDELAVTALVVVARPESVEGPVPGTGARAN
jgi:SAM-dependent methyltransferase